MKQIIRAFSLGLFVAAVIIGFTYYVEEPSPADSTSAVSINETVTSIEEEGYYVYEEDMEQKVNELEQEIKSLESEQGNETDSNSADEHATNDQPVETTISIEEGMSIPTIVDLLIEKEIITDEDAFITYLEENEISRNIQIGEFTLHDQMEIAEIANILTGQ
ncbi:hypothetical protein ACTWP4_20965 [Gracilibacillus sp. D59]|uniref:hypothetical protein n=1 Tax=Gracilibacillus sp. D59 TaxID=3457434 RepID=UPI003FCD8D0B